MYTPKKLKELLKKYKPLTEKRTIELILDCKNNKDNDALQLLYLHNIRYITSATKKYVRNEDELYDYINEIYFVMDECVNKFDLNKNIKFITYLNLYIKKKCREITNQREIVNLNYNTHFIFKKIERYINHKANNEHIYFTECDTHIIADDLNIATAMVKRYFKHAYNSYISLNTKYDGDEEMIDYMASNDDYDLDYKLIIQHYKNIIQKKNPKHFNMIMDYFNGNYTYESLGKIYNLSDERVRQIIKGLKNINEFNN
ncbi:sigma factor-like helix-turn-helix DNA-binding protein [Galbibacter pacificus]|uniref:RNA polymerase sigma-70 region 4 domain-containing protein n=1 Tax=Galbibacter pacificus TaxID=2996052 RepID=A0ABT6FR79_9FLAO|nr:sigma factor-like helix-turn-helix DNA-binding protein [Galbibacter pacificus]MDG3581749.1 sigma factor-like helix-turn-helix DNA-binding protein [Galbibacter pacificus]MDG3585777.1 hypothetical protein [Galbibacter pacificus]